MTTPHAPTPGGRGVPDHVDADRIGDLVDGLLEAGDEAGVRAHLARCAACAAVERDQLDVRALLRDLPPVAMPTDVATRLDAALAAEARSAFGAPTAGGLSEPSARSPERPADDTSRTAGRPAGSTVMPIDAARRRRFRVSTAVLQVAAAIVLLGAVGALVVGALNGTGGSESATSAGPAAAGGASAREHAGNVATVYTASGRDYTAASLVAQGQRLLSDDDRAARLYAGAEADTPTAATDATGGLGSGSTGGGAPTSASPPAAAPSPGRAAAPSKRAVDACVSALGGGRAARAVDVARYEGKPALVVVFAQEGRPGAEIWVVGTACRPGDEQVLKVAFTDG